MTDYSFDKNLRLSLQRALLGAISTSFRAICYRVHALDSITLRCYCSTPPSVVDKEAMDIVSAEIYADFPELENIDIEFMQEDKPFGHLEQLDGTVYARRE